ncbi:MAG: allantoinase AllB [Bryobacteraceae bacterium]
MPELVIRGGMVATPAGVARADIAVEGGTIVAVAPELAGAAREIDARGLTVLPGAIDAHLHFNQPGRTEWEGAATGSRALASGGGTLYFDMPLNSSPCTVGAAEFDAKRAAMEQSSITDFGLWGGIVPGNREALAELAARGAVGFKAFMADSGLDEFPRADDLTLYEAMREAARLGLPVAVHAEDNDLVRALASRALAEGRTGIRDYLDSRPVLAEVAAIERAALLARETGARLYIVHVSSGRGVAAALEARARGVDIAIETCAHYLYFSEADMERIGAAAKCAPPLRPAAEREALWGSVLAGEVDVVSSDHSPAPPSLKQGANFIKIWGGIAGVESTRAVLGERAPIETVARLTAEFPARYFGIARKGRVAVGSDADLALVDYAAAHTLERDKLFQRHRLSPYAGASFRGVVRRTLAGGETIYLDGAIAGSRRARMVTTHATSGTYA